MTKNDTKAFSLLEILLASIIFIITISGVFATLNAVRKPVADKESALAAAVFGKQVLEALRSSVNASTFYGPCSSTINGYCGDFSLYLGIHHVPHGNLPQGLTWPTNLSSSNFISGCDTSVGCLVYTVACGDGSPPTSSVPPDCVNSSGNDIAREVTLSINWPEAP
jgi:type II secretory pathway pseudopilin PulG